MTQHFSLEVLCSPQPHLTYRVPSRLWKAREAARRPCSLLKEEHVDDIESRTPVVTFLEDSPVNSLLDFVDPSATQVDQEGHNSAGLICTSTVS